MKRNYKAIICLICILSGLVLNSVVILGAKDQMTKDQEQWSNLGQNSDRVIEGKVVKKESYWVNNTESALIYTKVNIEVQQSDGKTPKIIEVIYPGGTIGNERHVCEVNPYGRLGCEEGQTVTCYIDDSKEADGVSNVHFIKGHALQMGSISSIGTMNLFVALDYLYKWMSIGFVYDDAMWDIAASPIEYWVNPNLSGFTGEETQVQYAFNNWQNVDSSELEFDYDGTTIIDYASSLDANVVFWGNDSPTVPGRCWWYDSSGEIYGFDIRLNSDDFTWTDGGSGSSCDIESVTTHEIGHALNLRNVDDSRYDDVTMYKTYGGGTDEESLEAEDEAGIQYLYPTDTRPTVSITDPDEYDALSSNFVVTATASCGDGIDNVKFMFADDGDYDVAQGWTTMSYSGGSYSGTVIVSGLYPTGYYWLVVRAESNSTDEIYGYDYIRVEVE